MYEDQARILVVDDDHANRMIIATCFKNQHEILYATNGREGYEIARIEIPDIIIMDWDMPVMDGIDAILMLKSTQETQEIPVIMATGIMTTAENLKKALEAGAVDFVRKPLDFVELTSRVQASLRLSNSYKQIRRLMKKEQELLKEQLSHKERELTSLAIQAQEKNQFLTEITGEIERLGNRLDGLEANMLSTISKKLYSHIDSDKAWTNFLLHFESVHPDFFKSLKEEFPGLTNNEMRLAAYIKIGMDNKEMAQVAGISLGTIKSNLNRLKKKLSLNATDSIRDFIHGYSSKKSKLLARLKGFS